MSEFDFSSVPAVILAAGQGKRMNSNLPKVVHPVLGTPMVRWVVEALLQAGLKRLYAIVGYKKELVEKVLGDTCTCIDQGEPRGTGHAVLAAREALKDYAGPLLVLNGDSPLVDPGTLRTLILSLDKRKADGVVMTARVEDPSGYGRIVRDSEGRFQKIVEQADAKMEITIDEVNGGIYAFNAPKVFEVLDQVTPSKATSEIYLTDAIERLRAEGRTVEAARANNAAEALGINSRKDLVGVTNYLRWRILEQHMEGGVTIVDPSTTYIENGVTIGRDTIIMPYTVLQQGVTIGAGCRIGPFARLRGNTVLADGAEIGNFVEVKSTRMGAGSKAKHLAYLGDAVLGKNVNIGAGTITANYDGKSKHTTTLDDGASTGCNTVFVAPVKMGRDAKTGAGTVVPRGKDVPPGDVVVGAPARSIKKKVGSK